MSPAEHIDTLTQRRNWLTVRIAAKQQVGWDVTWDSRERDALAWALNTMNTAAELDTMFDEVDRQLTEGDFAGLDARIKATNVPGTPFPLLMGLLSITRPALRQLPSRAGFFDEVYRQFQSQGRDAEALLGGLR